MLYRFWGFHDHKTLSFILSDKFYSTDMIFLSSCLKQYTGIKAIEKRFAKLEIIYYKIIVVVVKN